MFTKNRLLHKKNFLDRAVMLVIALTMIFAMPAGVAFAALPSIGPNTAANNSGLGWISPGNVTASDDAYASVTLNTSVQATPFFTSTGFGFNVPADATVTGITVSVERKQSGTGGSFRDEGACLVINGSAVTASNRSTGQYWGTTDTVITFGGSHDLWGQSLTPAVVNSANFGFWYYARKITGTKTALIDKISMTVYYTFDTVPPVIDPQSNIVVEATSAAGAVVNFAPTATDNVDPSVTVVCSPASGSTFPLGTTTVTCNATDASENAAAPVTFTVTVVDTTAPVIANPGNMTVEATSAAGAVVMFAPVATDLVDSSVPVVCSTVSGTTFPLGTTEVTCTAVDDTGNVATPITFNVTVVDTTKPVIAITGSNTVTIDQHQAYTELGATFSDAVDGNGAAIIGGDTVDTAIARIYYVTYNYTDAAGNEAQQAARTIRIRDITAPVIAAQSDMIVEATSAAGAVVTFAPTATDNKDAAVAVVCSPASGSTFPLGTTQVTCTAVDSVGNAALPVTFNVTVVDTTAPAIAVTGDNPLNINQDLAYVEQGATWTDAVDGSGAAIVGGDAVNTAIPGTYLVAYTYTDAAGNAAQVTRTVNVLDTVAPVITLNGDNPMTVYHNAAYVEPGATAADNVDASVSVVIGGSVDTGTLGFYSVTYDATDSSGNAAIQQVRTVEVVKAPSVVTTITVDGPSPINIPGSIFSTTTATYTAAVFNQYGDPMPGTPVSWSLLSAKFGVGINAATGVVTVYGFASQGSITVVATNGAVSGSKVVNLVVPVRSVSLNKTSITLRLNRTITLSATVLPSNATNKAVTWSSSDPTIASVDASGKVTAKKVGTVIITVTTVDGAKTATCKVKVTR